MNNDIITADQGLTILASIAGGTATVLQNRSDDSTKRKLCEGFTGMLVGVFMGPWIADSINWHDDHARAAVCFVVAFIGIVIVGTIMEAAKSSRFKGWLMGLFNPKA
jgi:uncharacterized membrane protein YeaQ/YmgE (transglycosylase-associated protein family)